MNGVSGKVNAPPDNFWDSAEQFRAPSSGYLQLLDTELLMRRACEADVAVRLLVRPGDYVFPHTIIALGVPRLPAGSDGHADARRQPHHRSGPRVQRAPTDRGGGAGAESRRQRPGDGHRRHRPLRRRAVQFARPPLAQRRALPERSAAAVVPVTDFAGLVASMFDMIRQYGKEQPQRDHPVAGGPDRDRFVPAMTRSAAR